ncbi:MAG: hypothetical protein RLY16_186 [Bacteroidota bacterium]
MAKKFYQKFTEKKSGTIREEHRQAKRKVKKERAAAIDERFENKRKMKEAARALMEERKRTGQSTKHQPEVAAPIKAKSTGINKTGVIGKTAGSVAGNEMPLNKYIAHGGICSRRDAVELIKAGKVKVNNVVITEPAFKVTGAETITFDGKSVIRSVNLVYILLNKPKDYITTTDDPQGRKTVLQLVKAATDERIYPVGRLDRNTSGVLLLTNDGELTQKLSHPSYNITKVYEVKLDKPLTKTDFDKIMSGVELEDGMIQADTLAYADSKDKSVIGIEIHSGRNRIVRRIFESLGYDVKGLDRVMYANLTKKNVDRGKWRYLAEKEVRLLKYLNASYKKTADAPKAPAMPKPARAAKPTSEKRPNPTPRAAAPVKKKAAPVKKRADKK